MEKPPEGNNSSGGKCETGGGQRNLRGLLTDFTQETSMHGLGRVISSRYFWLRGLWAVFIVTAASVAAYNVVKVILIFFTYPVSTIVSLEYASKLQFPAVTVCNLNPMRKTQWDNNTHLQKLRDYDVFDFEPSTTPSTAGVTNGGNATNYHYDYGYIFDPEQIQEQEYRIAQYMDGLDKNIKKEFGHQLEDMLLDCAYHIYNCSAMNFTQFYNGNFGNCYTFNREMDAKSVTKPGPTRGLRLLLNVEEDEYMEMSATTGFKVVIHPQGTMPFPEDEGLMITPGFSSSVAISKLDIQRTASPYGNCVTYGKDGHYELNMYAREFGVGYSDKACRMTCYQTEVYERCGCCDRDYPCYLTTAEGEDLNSHYCNYSDSMTAACVSQTLDDFTNDKLGCSCRPSCKETSYTTEVSTGRWPSSSTEEAYVKVLRRQISAVNRTVDTAYLKKNIALVNIYYKQLNYEQIKTSPAYNWSRLLSDLGGQFGLWLGFSLLTALEFVQLAFDACQHLARGLCGSSSKTGPVTTRAVSVSHIH